MLGDDGDRSAGRLEVVCQRLKKGENGPLLSPEEAPKILSTWRKRGGLKRRVDFPSRCPERPRRTEQKADPWDIILFPFPKIVAFSESSEVMYAWARRYNSVHSRLRNAILILGENAR